MIKVYYHAKGCDNNGNFGPAIADKGWVCIEVESVQQPFTEALEHLPTAEQVKVSRELAQHIKEECDWFDQHGRFNADCGLDLEGMMAANDMGRPFTMYTEEAFDMMGEEPPIAEVINKR